MVIPPVLTVCGNGPWNVGNNEKPGQLAHYDKYGVQYDSFQGGPRENRPDNIYSGALLFNWTIFECL